MNTEYFFKKIISIKDVKRVQFDLNVLANTYLFIEFSPIQGFNPLFFFFLELWWLLAVSVGPRVSLIVYLEYKYVYVYTDTRVRGRERVLEYSGIRSPRTWAKNILKPVHLIPVYWFIIAREYYTSIHNSDIPWMFIT